MAYNFIRFVYMQPDTILWCLIFIYTFSIASTNIDVIHGAYDLTRKTKINMYWHQFIGSILVTGLFFQKRSMIELHLYTAVIVVTCWFLFKGCFLAEWERQNIPYKPDDFLRIQFTPEKRWKHFLMFVPPLILIDLYKLRGHL